jgi:ArsR family transcriptional regulator, arsenate/arsenite/antimonite-responsive transcriptional repressor
MVDCIYGKTYIQMMLTGCRQLFQLLSDDTRFRCAVLIWQQGELCVCELVHALDLVQPKVSRHLAALREAGVVEGRRAGQWVYYSIHSELPDWAGEILHVVVAAAARQEPYAGDMSTLIAMPNRPANLHCA